jgi:hypothetical protein
MLVGWLSASGAWAGDEPVSISLTVPPASVAAPVPDYPAHQLATHAPELASPPIKAPESGCSGGCASCAGGKGKGGWWGGRDSWCVWVPALEVPPVGTATRSAFELQRLHALAEYFVLFREDFDVYTNTLNETGKRHLAGIQTRMGQTSAPVKVEPTGDRATDTVRQAYVVRALMENGANAESTARVVIGTTKAEGLHGEFIEAAYRGAFSQGQNCNNSLNNNAFNGYNGYVPGLYR